jgi:hypothetical protein
MATEDFPVLLAPSDSMVPLEVWLSEAEAWLPSNGFKFNTDGSLFEGRTVSGDFSKQLDLKASFVCGTFATVFQAEVYAVFGKSDKLKSI